MEQLKIGGQIFCRELKHLNELMMFIGRDYRAEIQECQKMVSR